MIPSSRRLSIGWTILGGGIGAFIGGLIAKAAGVKDTSGPDWIQYLLQAIAAAVVVVIIAAYQGRSKRA